MCRMVHIGITDTPKPGSRAEPGFLVRYEALGLFGSGCKSLFQGKQREDFQIVDELVRLLLAAPN